MKFTSLLRTAAPAAALVVCCGEAWAQSAPAARFSRTTTGAPVVAAAAARSGRAPAVERSATASRSTEDPLAPYTSKPAVGTYTARPAERPPAPAVSRNYYPTARTGQYQSRPVQSGHGHCTPSRAVFYGRGF